MNMRLLKVKNWDKFQHYKDRNPPWIKLATDTFQNYEFSRLQDASKLLAVCIWTLAARSKDGSIPYDFEYIKRQCSLGSMVKESHLKELINQGFIEDDSDMLADCKQSAIPEAEGEGETEGYSKEGEKSIGDFENFWEEYGKIGSKQTALKIFQKIKGVDYATIIAGLRRYQEQCRALGTERKYIKHASTWLDARGWEDEYPVVAGGGDSSGKQKDISNRDRFMSAIFNAGTGNQ